MCLPSDALLQHLPSCLGSCYLGLGVSLHGCSSKVKLLLLTLDKGYLLTAALPDLHCGLLNLSCIFSILVSRLFICDSILISGFWIIFTIIIQNSLSGRFLISSCYSLELCIQMLISFLFSFAFCLSSFHMLKVRKGSSKEILLVQGKE